MADLKISAMTAAAALGGTEKIPAVQGGANVYLTPAQQSTYIIGASAGAGTPGFTLTGGLTLGQITGANASYTEFDLQNTTSGAAASTDFVINSDNATNTTHYGNFGKNSSGFTGTGSLNAAGYTYLTSTSDDLVIGTTTANAIRFVTNGAATDAMQISSAGVITHLNGTTLSAALTYGGVTLSNSVVGTGSMALGVGQTAFTPSDTSGASLTFTGVTAYYTQVGKQVTFTLALTYPTTASGANASIGLGALPNFYASASVQILVGTVSGTLSVFKGVANANNLTVFTTANAQLTNATMSTLPVLITGTYLSQ